MTRLHADCNYLGRITSTYIHDCTDAPCDKTRLKFHRSGGFLVGVAGGVRHRRAMTLRGVLNTQPNNDTTDPHARLPPTSSYAGKKGGSTARRRQCDRRNTCDRRSPPPLVIAATHGFAAAHASTATHAITASHRIVIAHGVTAARGAATAHRIVAAHAIAAAHGVAATFCIRRRPRDRRQPAEAAATRSPQPM